MSNAFQNELHLFLSLTIMYVCAHVCVRVGNVCFSMTDE